MFKFTHYKGQKHTNKMCRIFAGNLLLSIEFKTNVSKISISVIRIDVALGDAVGGDL